MWVVWSNIQICTRTNPWSALVRYSFNPPHDVLNEGLQKLIDKVELFRVNELFALGRYYELEEDTMLLLLMNQYR